jgi:hypothetical protein
MILDIILTALVAYLAGLGTAALVQWLRYRAWERKQCDPAWEEFDAAVTETFKHHYTGAPTDRERRLQAGELPAHKRGTFS